jgi:hypothetical protein
MKSARPKHVRQIRVCVGSISCQEILIGKRVAYIQRGSVVG